MGDVARRLASGRHGHGAVRFLERKDVVDAVARHGDGVSLLFDGAHQDRLLFGGDASEHRVLIGDVFHFQVGQPVEGDILSCIFDAHAPRHFGHGDGIVARDDLDFHVVLAEPLDGFDRVRTDIVRQRDDRRGTEQAGQPSARDGAGGIGEQQHAHARRGVLLDDLVDLGRHGAQHEFGRAHREGARLAEGHGGELALARKGDGRRRLQGVRMPETVVQGDGGLVVVVKGGEHAAHDLFDGIVHKVVQDHHVVHRHPAVRDGARLVQAQHVDAGKHFQRIQVLYERLLFGEPHDADRHGKRSEQQQSRRDHADDDRARELDGHAHVRTRRLPVHIEHRRGDKGDKDADDADEQPDGVHDLRARLFILFRLGGEGVEVGRLAHLVGAHAAGAARHVRARIQRLAGRLFDGDRFARQKRFVDLHVAVEQDAVGGDLLSRFQQDDVVQHDVPHADLRLYAVAHDFGGRRNEHGEFIDLLFGEDLLHDADEQVRREDGDEQELRDGRARIGERERHDQAQQVEERADIPHEDARVGFGILFADVVEQELRKAQFRLFGSEPLVGIGRKALHVFGGGQVFGAAEALHQFFSVKLIFAHRAAAHHALGKAFALRFGLRLFLRLFGEPFVFLLVQCRSPCRVFARRAVRRHAMPPLYTVCAQMSKITQRLSLFFARPRVTVAIRAKKVYN